MRKDYFIKTKVLYAFAVILLALCLTAGAFALSACQSKLSKIQAQYTGSNLEIGQKINKSDVTVTVIYEDGSSKPATDFTMEDCDTAVSGKHTVKVSYSEGGITRHTTFDFTVNPEPVPALLAISVTYKGGEMEVGETLNKSDIVVTATYNNGENQPIEGLVKTVTDYKLEYDFSTVGDKTVTVSYSELAETKTASFTVKVVPKVTLTEISAQYVGENIPFGLLLSLNDIAVTAKYDDGSEKLVTGFEALNFNPSQEGEQQVTIVYTHKGVTKQCQITVTVNEKTEETANYGKYGILQDDGSVKITNTAYVNGELQIHFVAFDNVSSGDCIFIKAGDTDVLIDAGSTEGSSSVIDKYISQFCTDKKLEYAIATHAHTDHISAYVGGFSSDGTDKKTGILDLFKIDTLIKYNKVSSTSQLSQRFDTKVSALAQKGTNVYSALDCYNNANGASRIYKLSDSVEMEILYNYYYDHSTTNENLNSVCVILHQYGAGYDFENPDNPNNEHFVNHYLFTGDLEESGEAMLVKNNDLPKVVLYKAGHHGSATASSLPLLNVIQPKLVCMCSCAGDGRYNFPRQQAIDRMSTFTDLVFVTNLRGDGGATAYLNGNISVKSNPQGVFVNGTNNNVMLKDTDWFKANRETPEAWKSAGEQTE